jgi:MFS family permease
MQILHHGSVEICLAVSFNNIESVRMRRGKKMHATERAKNVRYNVCCCICACIRQGINIGIFSPTFPDMERMTSSSTVQMSTTLTWIGVASAVGAVLSGPLFDRFNGHGVLALALLAQGVAIGVAPWCRLLISYQIMSAIACIFNFAIMCGESVSSMRPC